jgi:hypothetical protein
MYSLYQDLYAMMYSCCQDLFIHLYSFSRTSQAYPVYVSKTDSACIVSETVLSNEQALHYCKSWEFIFGILLAIPFWN